jgi:hypothetical protein
MVRPALNTLIVAAQPSKQNLRNLDKMTVHHYSESEAGSKELFGST